MNNQKLIEEYALRHAHFVSLEAHDLDLPLQKAYEKWLKTRIGDQMLAKLVARFLGSGVSLKNINLDEFCVSTEERDRLRIELYGDQQ